MPRRAATSANRSSPRGVASPRRAPPAVLELIRAVRQQSAIAGKCWDKSEAALEALVDKLGAGKVVGIEPGVFAKIVDLFAEANSVYVPKVMKRYKLVICDANGKEIRLRDRVGRHGKGKAPTKTKAKTKKGK